MSKSERKFSSTVSHDEAVVKMLRENPSYAQLYLQIALDEIYEDQDPSLFDCPQTRYRSARRYRRDFSQSGAFTSAAIPHPVRKW